MERLLFIDWAARYGYTEIVKILAPLTDPNAPDHNGKTPIMVAKNEKIRKILKSFINSRKRKSNHLLNRQRKRNFEKKLCLCKGGRLQVPRLYFYNCCI